MKRLTADSYHTCEPSCTHRGRMMGYLYNDGTDLRMLGKARDYRRWAKELEFTNYEISINGGDDEEVLGVILTAHDIPGSRHPLERSPGKSTHIFVQYVVPAGLDHEEFVDRVYHFVQLRSEHETAENFLVRGKLYRDPHDPFFISRLADPPPEGS